MRFPQAADFTSILPKVVCRIAIHEPMNSNINRISLRTLGASLLLGSALAANANTIVNFQVDMSTAGIDPNTQTVQVRGNFEGWGGGPVALTNNPLGANPYLFTGTTNMPQNGIVIAYKYVIMPGAAVECSHNRLLTL